MSGEDTSHALNTEFIDSIAVIRFNRPAERNPLSGGVLREIDRLLLSYAARRDLKVLIITGTEDVFASGADLRELNTLDPARAREFSQRGQQIFQRIAALEQVTIAAINGYCMGGALDLALACEVRVASREAIFSHPGGRRGIITGWGGTQRLARLIGRSRALDLFCTTRRVSSAEALQMGLVSRIEDPVLDGALQIAREVIRQGGK